MRNYIFGYGSLINTESREQSSKTEDAIPVKVDGFQRSWCISHPKAKQTVLGIYPSAGGTCNGVLFEVSATALERFDERELPWGYQRVLVSSKAIVAILGKVPAGTVWTYVVPHPKTPSKDCPIAQSYLDIVLSGCLQFGETFAKTFIETTLGWKGPWVDDRDNPLCLPLKMKIPIENIDALLKELLPQEFANRI